MNRKMYARLAWNNIRRNRKIYVPYMLAAICIIAMFFNINFVIQDETTVKMVNSASVILMLQFGNWFVGFFSVLFLFYVNSFLIKRRKTEIGLLNVLGMEKRHIARLLAAENNRVALISISGGLFCGITLGKLIQLTLFLLLRLEISWGFRIPLKSVGITVLLFAAIFLLTLIWNLWQIRLNNPIQLLQGGSKGEREPKSRWILASIGVGTLLLGYIIALTTKDPVQGLFLFLVAVILVTIGTYCLFTAGSIVLLKSMKKNKRYYYQAKHFYSVSGMIYRMKQNAAGLATICILCTCVLVTVSTTVSLYAGIDDVLKIRFPKEFSAKMEFESQQAGLEGRAVFQQELQEANLSMEEQEELLAVECLLMPEGEGYRYWKEADGYNNNVIYVTVMSTLEYKRLTGESVLLGNGNISLYDSDRGEGKTTLDLLGQSFRIEKQLKESPIPNFCKEQYGRTLCIVVDNENDILTTMENPLNLNLGEGFRTVYHWSADTTKGMSTEQAQTLKNALKTTTQKFSDQKIPTSVAWEYSGDFQKEVFQLYGGLLFLGLFLGAIFLLATVLIIYYKQITEGYEDRERFQIMQKVGMDQMEVKRTIKSQVLTVFMLPIVAAALHLTFAFPMLCKMLTALHFTNESLFALCTILTAVIFAVLYGLVYAITARVYYKIVR